MYSISPVLDTNERENVPLRSVPERQEETHHKQPEVDILNDDVCDMNVGDEAFHGAGQDDERDVVVALVIRSIWSQRSGDASLPRRTRRRAS